MSTNDDLRNILDTVGLGDLADDLAPVLTKIAAQAAAKATAPLSAHQQRDAAAAQARRASEELAAFSREVPDWKEHEAAMFALSKQIHPTASMTPRECSRTPSIRAAEIRRPGRQIDAHSRRERQHGDRTDLEALTPAEHDLAHRLGTLSGDLHRYECRRGRHDGRGIRR